MPDTFHHQSVETFTLELGAPCVKCKTLPITVIVRQAAYCNGCFQEVAFHKYRAAVSKAKAGKNPEKILLAVSTGPSSRLLLYLSQLPRIQEPSRKNLDTFVAIHVQDKEEERSHLQSLKDYCNELGVQLQLAPLSESLQSPEAYSALMTSCKSETVRMDLKRLLLKRLLVAKATELGCGKVYFGDCNDRMAINAIADVCSGRGASIPWSQMPCQPLGGVQIVRPLRDLQAQEVQEYLKIIHKAIPAEQLGSKDTIYGLTDAFITGLAKDFAATPSIVTKTTAKIMTEQTPLSADSHCSLCYCPLLQPSHLCEACDTLCSDLDPALLN